MKHALLSASGASRWLTCTPSPRLEEQMPESESVYADEGTLAHELSEWLIRHKAFGVGIKKKLAIIEANDLYSEEMHDYCNTYADFVVNTYRDAPKGSFLIQEQRLNLTDFIPQGFGTSDVGIISPKKIHVIDLKYGKGVPVDAYENNQLMVYGLGVYMVYDLLFDIQEIELTVYQPRIDNTSSYTISAENLLRWGREVLKPTAKIAFEGVGELVAGDHCRFCRFRPRCSEFATRNLQLAAREFAVTSISDEQLVKILNRADQIKNWLTSVENYALSEAIKGKKWPGLKIVSGRSVRKITDEEKLFKSLQEKGYSDEKLLKKKMIGITELGKILPKKEFDEVVAPLLVKPPGAPTLVSNDDTRPEWNATAGAISDFED